MSEKYAKRYEAVYLCSHLKVPKLSYSAAAKVIKKSKKFVVKWHQRYIMYKNVDGFSNRGLKRATTSKQDKAILQLFERDPSLRLRQARTFLAKRGIDVSTKIIERHLKEANIFYCPPTSKPLLSDKHIDKRKAWVTENMDHDWTKVFFSDEATFWALIHRKRAWSTRVTNFIERTVNHPVKVNVWGCFSERGFGCLELFAQNLNAEKMVQIYENWVLQEDNDPKHRSRLFKSWKEKNGVATIERPSQSPDANPLENVCGIMKTHLAGKPVHDLKQLVRAIRNIWSSLSTYYAKRLVESMPRRCQDILDNDGDYTAY